MFKNFLKNHHIHKKIVPYLDEIFIYNPTLFFTIWVMICMGMYIGHQNIGSYPQWITSGIGIKVILLFISLTFLIGATFIKEQLICIDSSSNQIKKTPLIIFMNKERAVAISKFSVIIGIGILLFINIYNFVLSLFVFLALNFYFTNKDKLSKNYYFSYALIFLVSTLLILNGYVIVVSNNFYFFSLLDVLELKTLLILLFYALTSLSIFIMIQVLKQSDNRVILRFLSSLIMLIVFIFSIYFNDPLLSVSSISSLPFLLYALFRNLNKDLVRSVRYPIFIFNFFIFTIYPYISIPLILIFYISKYYYWHRFDIHFPTFLVEND